MSVFNVYDKAKRDFCEGAFPAAEALTETFRAEDLYIAPPFIDMHTHVYDRGGVLSISADISGLNRGVHMVIDAGSAGVDNLGAFRDYVVPATKTPIKAFLNISSLGLASPQPYHDMRLCDPERTAQAVIDDGGKFLLGVKVLTSRVRVEDSLAGPISLARKAADLAGCPLMAHHAEGPPYNDETLPYMLKGDIVTHCFHGDMLAEPNPLWKPDGTPIPSLREALDRGVLLDVGHGYSSMRASVAKNVISTGFKNFTISTDLHSMNVYGPVYGLAETMSKFFGLGLSLGEIVDSVTYKVYSALRLKGWGEDLSKDCTIFTLEDPAEDKRIINDAEGEPVVIEHMFRPVAIIRNGELIKL